MMIQEDRSISKDHYEKGPKLNGSSHHDSVEDRAQLLYHNTCKDRSRTNKVSRNHTESVESQNQIKAAELSPSNSRESDETQSREVGNKKILKIPKGAKALLSNYEDMSANQQK